MSADGFPVTITDYRGYQVEIDPGRGIASGQVHLRTSPQGVILSLGQCEALAQALVAACWRAGHREGYGCGRDDEASGLPVSDMRTVADEPAAPG